MSGLPRAHVVALSKEALDLLSVWPCPEGHPGPLRGAERSGDFRRVKGGPEVGETKTSWYTPSSSDPRSA